ncbi:MAG TPA: Fic family protein [Acidimicrobiales bacterium]|nr:Fic family protein [Acidimicrobiales bacterium]
MNIPQRPPRFEEVFGEIRNAGDLDRIFTHSTKPVDERGRYLHWDEMRNRTPPSGLTQREWWLTMMFARRGIARDLPLRATDGTPFRFCNIDMIQEMVHRIDQQASGQILADDLVMNLRSSDHYLVSSLAEEAITSSQLEGASTTRRVAKELLATGRKPRDRSEQMIVNNFQAMIFAQQLEREELSPTDVLDLHRIVTENTLDDPADAGRLQGTGDERVAVYWHDNTLLHRPPPANELADRLDAMCRFANEETSGVFIHPVVRAIVIHFWLAYDHPFVDGNGRTARALFYWSMLHNRYWLAQYLSVSSILLKAPAQYVNSYLLTETDGYDITYFVIYQLVVIERAIKSLHEYLSRKIADTRKIEGLLHGSPHLNNRQLVVVRDALRNGGETFTIAAQSRRHRVTYESARSDLLGLEKLGLLTRRKVGKKYVFSSMPDLVDRLRHLGGEL